jgi:hypothetical protein
VKWSEVKWSEVHPRTGYEGPEGEQRYSFTLSLTSALDGVDCQCHAPVALLPKKTPYTLYRRLGVSQGLSGPMRKISPPPGFDPWTVQQIPSLYTDWAIPVHTCYIKPSVLCMKPSALRTMAARHYFMQKAFYLCTLQDLPPCGTATVYITKDAYVITFRFFWTKDWNYSVGKQGIKN